MKVDIRNEVQKIRNDMSFYDVECKSSMIVDYLIQSKEIKEAKIIACYYPFQNEVDIRTLIELLLKAGKKVLLPKIKQKMIRMYQIKNISDVHSGHFGIYEPNSIFEHQGRIDLMIVPLIAFNLNKDRIGFGKGYYDQFLLTRSAITIGVAYEFQKYNFNSELHDMSLSMIVTEKGWYK